MSDVKNEASSEGGQNVGFINNGDYIAFNNVNFGTTGPTQFYARVATTAGGNIEIRLDSLTGTLVGTCPVTSTGGWQTWATQIVCSKWCHRYAQCIPEVYRIKRVFIQYQLVQVY